MARTAMVACLLIVLAACAWLLFASDEQQPLLTRPALAQAPAEPRGEPETPTPVAAPSAHPTERTSAPEETAAQPAVPADATRLEVTIVDKETCSCRPTRSGLPSRPCSRRRQRSSHVVTLEKTQSDR